MATACGQNPGGADATFVAIGLGGNEEHTEDLFRSAIRSLSAALCGVRVAPLYRSTPLGSAQQRDFLNTVLVGWSALGAEDLLAICKTIEKSAGRRLSPRNSPRPLDLDLLLWDDRVSRAPELTLPHPRLPDRRFVLRPLCDLLPSLPIPGAGAAVSELLEIAERHAAPGEVVERCEWRRQPLA